MEYPPRKRLQKLSGGSLPPEPPDDIIPKKQNSSLHRTNGHPKSHAKNEDSDSIEEFLSDRIVYEGGAGPPLSSSESAHSTDGENLPKKRRREQRAERPSQPSAQSSEQEDSAEEEKPVRLVGKQALEAKRKQGLCPKKENAKKSRKDPAPAKPTRNRETARKNTQFAEFENEEDRKKAEVVALVLVRWWYALDDWPPAELDYTEQLRNKRIRVVVPENWSVEQVLDERGHEKVLEVPGFRGLYKNCQGKIFDLRPLETAPTFNNLFGKSLGDLTRILVKCLKGQLEALELAVNKDEGGKKVLLKLIEYWASRGEQKLN